MSYGEAASVNWVSWQRSKLSHACPPLADRVGSFPLKCGKWAPDAFDAGYMDFNSTKPRCARCQRAVDKLAAS